MKLIVVALFLVGLSGVAFAEDERTVIVPVDDDAFVVTTTDIVRLTGKGITGSTIETKIEGPAKIDATSRVQEIKKGHPMIGNLVKQFDLKPTAAGKVSVTITVTSPIPGTKPQIRKIEFEVK